MNTQPEPSTAELLQDFAPAPRFRDLVLAAIAETCAGPNQVNASREMQFLSETAASFRRDGISLRQALENICQTPDPEDARLVRLSEEMDLSPVELLAIAIAASVEKNAFVGRVIAHVQAPIGGSRPTLGLLDFALSRAIHPDEDVLPTLVKGMAVRSGLLSILNETAPLPERPILLTVPLALALAGHDSPMPGATVGLDAAARLPLPGSIVRHAEKQALALRRSSNQVLVLRTGSPAEGRSVANAVALALNRRPVFIDADTPGGIGPWLLLRRLTPVFCMELAPGERRRLRDLTGYRGPVLVVTGPDGSIETPLSAAATWTIPVPPPAERRELWRAALGEGARETTALAESLAGDFRHSTGRIAHVGRLARHHAALSGHPSANRDDVLAAAWSGEGGGLDALAQPLRTHVPDDALITTAELRANLEALMLRCRMREALSEGLGASATTRYRPGVRALFTGPSGTGKTLAADWIATHLGLPLYRVDLASVTSKYIGETEKNLSQLLARAEQAEVMLLFDEADSLFGKRTEISDSNDRFANAQTNYLLQRIENYEGIVLLTSNSQARFDDAFSRRLDFIIEFPLPGPEERRDLWKSHLGPDASLGPADINRIAVLVDFGGGHIRNAVLAAAVLARRDRRQIELADLLSAIESELRKLGRQMPIGLQDS